MKKVLFTIVAATLGLSTFAQTNLALDKSAKASSVSTEAGRTGWVADNATKDDATQWASDYTTEGMTDAERDAQWFYVDLGSEQTVQKVTIQWDNQPAKTFDIRCSTADPGATPKTAGSVALADLSGSGNTTDSYDFASAVTARYVILDLKERATGWGYGIVRFKVFATADAAVLTTIDATAAKTTLTVGDAPVAITAKGFDQYGVAFAATYTYESSATAVATVSSDGQITAVAAGTATITVKGSETVMATIDITVKEAVSLPATCPAAPTGDVAVVYDGTTGTWSDQGWGWGGTQKDVAIAGKTCRQGTDLGGMQIPNSLTDYSGYKKLVADVYAVADHSLTLFFEGEGTTKTFALVAGWNKLEADITAVDGTKVNYLTFQYSNDPKDGVLIFSNVYYSKEEAADPFTLAIADGVATITGKVLTTDAAAINAADAMLIDFSGATSVESGIVIAPLHANALIKVNADSEGTIAANNGALAGTKNLVRIDTWVFPLTKLQVTDKAGEPLWSGEGSTQTFISTGSTGYTLTRHLAVGSYATTCLPTATTAPAQIDVYEFTSDADNKLTFSKKANGEIIAGYPYLLHATADADLVAEGTGDFVGGTAGSTTQGAVTFKGSYAAFTTDGTEQYAAINPATNHLAWLGNGATVGAFRAYFEGVTETAAVRIALADNTVTGISTMHNAQSTMHNEVYNLQGQRVGNAQCTMHNAQLKPGLYIQNGKKVAIK